MNETITTTLDLKGLSCPMPIAKTAQAIRGLQPGELIDQSADANAELVRGRGGLAS